MLNMAEKLEKIEKMVEPKISSDEVVVIADSNGKFLQPNLLHHEKTVSMKRISTLEEACKNIPDIENRDAVTDVVFMTGLNDSRDHEVVNRQKEACHKFHQKYKNARFHIVATAPYTTK